MLDILYTYVYTISDVYDHNDQQTPHGQALPLLPINISGYHSKVLIYIGRRA